jgi:hypothetical protein
MVAMLSAAIVLAPVGAVAATNAFTISDPAHPAHKAHVSSKGGLAVTAQDGTTGVRAKVDKSGHTVVGDGSGALTVDGTVHTSAPSATWHFTNTNSGTYFDLTLPRNDAANLTSLFASGDSTTQFIYLGIYAATVPTSATTSCSSSPGSSELIWQGEAGGAAGAKIPIAITFPTPLKAQPASGKKICLYAYMNHSGNAIMSASGYYGG